VGFRGHDVPACARGWLRKVGYTLVTLPRIVTLYRDSVDETRNVSKIGYAVTVRACLVCCRYLAVTSKG